ncbi:MAG: hypothetical protein JW889_04985 [Verrucomicrobia bacterium]|nr:hypothetical protein [Verrucomicrobiota bacterium]
MKKVFAYMLLVFVAVGLLLSTGCFETTAGHAKNLGDWAEVTFVDGDAFLKEVR